MMKFRNAQHAPDHGTSERWKHSSRALELTERAGVLVSRSMTESLIDKLLERGLISMAEHEAGMRLRCDFHAAKMQARLTSSYSSARNPYNPFNPCADRTDEEEEAYGRWRQAIRAVGPRYSDTLISTVCHEVAPRSVYDVKIGLSLLVKHYQQ